MGARLFAQARGLFRRFAEMNDRAVQIMQAEGRIAAIVPQTHVVGAGGISAISRQESLMLVLIIASAQRGFHGSFVGIAAGHQAKDRYEGKCPHALMPVHRGRVLRWSPRACASNTSTKPIPRGHWY